MMVLQAAHLLLCLLPLVSTLQDSSQCAVVEDVFDPAPCLAPCSNDRECPLDQVCCKVSPSSDCDHECQVPTETVECIDPDAGMLSPGEQIENGDGNCCTCQHSGEVTCTNGPCNTDDGASTRPGFCPDPTGSQLCGEAMCTTDSDCGGSDKCCPAIGACQYSKTCAAAIGASTGCIANRSPYSEGEVVRVVDRCNNCTCLSGEVVCTDAPCPSAAAQQEEPTVSSPAAPVRSRDLLCLGALLMFMSLWTTF
ncbi:von Willebrand factor C and EGF domain-containing protein-like isoform X2 [Branchiostoma lanceolatum]|uniref:Hypp2412 protein n=1 Tax=Branchiostoma lanceolatum TaxID=7740 RepID=A0A8J9ZTD8_BRALA|nr:Hypp2412 [Branchiostoma lanceolatum]CAH1261631.1 Hypp2412 [Branchiostoma lanceolatum]